MARKGLLGKEGKDSKERTARKGQQGKDSKEWMARKGQRRKERTVRKGRICKFC